MRAMRPHRKLELEQKLVRGQAVSITGTPELSANLAELARPVGQNQRSAGVDQLGVVEAAGTIEAAAQEPSPRELVIRGNIESRGRRADIHGLLCDARSVLATG